MHTAPTRVLLAMSDTGGGHRSAAVAIGAALQEACGDLVSCEIMDILKLTGVPLVRSSPMLYNYLSTSWLPFYNAAYHLTDSRRPVEMVSQFVNIRARYAIGRMLRKVQPHLVVLVHPLVQRLIGSARRTHRLPFRMVTVVTDLVTLHYSWTYTGVDTCVLPTDEAYDLMRQRGMPPELMVRTGFPVHPKFVHYSCSREESRLNLNLAQDCFTILVTSGGVGAGRMQELVLALEESCPDKQILVITGKNQALHDDLVARRRSPRTRIYGFVHNMEAFMAASDIVVTKAGPGTLMEALVMRRPVIVTEAVGRQEWGNIDFILNHGLGFFRPTPERIIEAIAQLTNPQRYADTVARLEGAVPRDGAAQIVGVLLQQVPHLTHALESQRTVHISEPSG